MKKIILSFVLGFIFGVFFWINTNSLENGSDKQKYEIEKRESILESKKDLKLYSVISVIDGDTIKIKYNNKKKSVRVLGINTPEKKNPFRPEECFGDEATKRAKELLAGKKISIVFDESQSKFDKFDRILAFVLINGKEDFGEKMIKDGYAYEYTYHGLKHKNTYRYKEAEKEAKKLKKGLWADNACKRDK